MIQLRTLALAALAASTLAAGDFTGGLQLGAAFPAGDMKTVTDGKTGAALVLFGRWDLGGGQAIRLRLDGVACNGSPDTIPTPAGPRSPQGHSITASKGTLGGDYLYYPGGTLERGAYLGAGLGYSNNKVSLEDQNNTIAEQSSGGLGVGLYAGWQFNSHWNVELAFHTSQFKSDFNGQDWKYNMPSTALLVGFTF